MKYLIFLFLGIVGLLACQNKPTKTAWQPGGAEQGFLPPPVWNASMQSLKQSMIVLEPYVFNKEQFSDPKNHNFLKKEIHKLAAESKNIKHDPIVLTKDPTVLFVASQFSEELQRADENFSTGWNEYSRWQLAKVTSYCLECHTRLREGPAFSADETTQTYLATLTTADQIEFMIAFRQFESAFKIVLNKLKEPQSGVNMKFEPDRVARLGLLISVQYLQNSDKAKKIIEAIDQNGTLPLYLKQSNRLWKKSLEKWDENESLKVLPEVRSLVKHRISEIEDMRAIPALLRILTESLSRDELGEALFLTGKSYEALNKISVLSLHENYYESCVRKTPETKWAPLCYDKLSDSITLGYTGSSGTHIPSDVQNKLQEVKLLIKKTRAGK